MLTAHSNNATTNNTNVPTQNGHSAPPVRAPTATPIPIYSSIHLANLSRTDANLLTHLHSVLSAHQTSSEADKAKILALEGEILRLKAELRMAKRDIAVRDQVIAEKDIIIAQKEDELFDAGLETSLLQSQIKK